MVSHRSLVNYLEWARRAYSLEAGDGAPLATSVTYDLSLTSLFGPLIAGRAVTIVEEGPGVDSLARTMRIHPGFALLKITPTHLASLNEMLSPEEVAAAAQTIGLGGEN